MFTSVLQGATLTVDTSSDLRYQYHILYDRKTNYFMTSIQTIEEAHTAGHISDDVLANVKQWLTEPKYREYKEELESMIEKGDWKTLNDHFFKVVPFGTGGRRGTVGIGSNRINNVTIGESAQGLADYLLSSDPTSKDKGVVIAYDTRLTSEGFSQLTASVLAANGFKVFLFDGFRATPELSFAVRHLQTAAGVVISASHNPPADNGFKVYWSDGGQIVAPHDKALMETVGNVKEIQKTSFEDAVKNGSITTIGSDIDTAYIDAILNESVSPSRSATIVYSPLHGTGIKSVQPALEKAGFSLTMVEEQAQPDGNFPTVPNNSPNPENIPASDLVIEKAKAVNADIGITTDPDCDRLGVVARAENGSYTFLTGNQIAALIGYFVLKQLHSQNKLSPEHFVVKTIVTTDFITAMAKDFGVKVYDQILIGFKFVADLIHQNQDKGSEQFVFGGEESHGILKGAYTRDKDAAIAALLMAELVSSLKDEGKTLLQQLDELYAKYGVYYETLQNFAYQGAEGGAIMAAIMKGLREHPPTTVGAHTVVSVIDRSTGKEYSPATKEPIGEISDTKGDVLIFNLSDDKQTRLTVRPSGTEPKLKVYTQVHETVTDAGLAEAKTRAEHTAKALADAMAAYLESLKN